MEKSGLFQTSPLSISLFFRIQTWRNVSKALLISYSLDCNLYVKIFVIIRYALNRDAVSDCGIMKSREKFLSQFELF